MRRMICLLAVLLVCTTLVSPAFAAEDIFVPSISYKEGPEIEGAVLGKNEAAPDEGTTPDGEPVDQEHENVGNCLVVTSIIQAQEKTTDIYQEDRDTLLEVYEKLENGEMKLPDAAEEKPDGFVETIRQWFGGGKKSDGIQTKSDGSMQLTFDNEDYVILELVDISFRRKPCIEVDHYHKEELEREDTTITVDFDLGVAENDKVVVLTYRDEKWEPIKSVKNNGDGTVTCVFEHFCPVAFCVEAAETAPDETGSGNLIFWIVLLLASMAVVVVMLARRRKKVRAA